MARWRRSLALTDDELRGTFGSVPGDLPADAPDPRLVLLTKVRVRVVHVRCAC
jgi:hypothetical protein